MAEELQGLLERINRQGIEETQQKTGQMLEEAKTEAAAIIAKAKEEASGIVKDAKNEALKEREKTDAALKQASRDLLISVRKTLEAELKNVVAKAVASQVKGERLGTLIEAMVKGFAESGFKTSDIEVLLGADQAKEMEQAALAGFAGLLKDGLQVKPVHGVEAGFQIGATDSDAKFDLTDEALTELICAFLSPKLAELIKA